MTFTSAVFDTGLAPVWSLFAIRPSLPWTFGLFLFAAIAGFWLGNVVATRSLYRVNCSCHTPFRWAMLKYAGMSLVVTLMLASSGCFWPHCRDPKTGRFISCKDDRAIIAEMRRRQTKVEIAAAKQREAEDLQGMGRPRTAEGTNGVKFTTSCAALHIGKDGEQIPCPGYH